jgi:hypothetical protein
MDERQQIEDKLKQLKTTIMDLLSQATAIEYELNKLTIKKTDSPPRKKSFQFPKPVGPKTKQKKRVKPEPAEKNIPQEIDWKKEEEQWFIRRANRQNESIEALAKGNRHYIDENTQVEFLPGEEEELPDNDYTIGYSYKAKSHTRETITQWVDRLVHAVLEENINPFLTIKSLEDMFSKLKKKFKNLNMPNTMMLKRALQNFGELKKLFSQLKVFMNQNIKQKSNIKT